MGDDCAQTFYPNLNVTLYFQQKQQSLAVSFKLVRFLCCAAMKVLFEAGRFLKTNGTMLELALQ